MTLDIFFEIGSMSIRSGDTLYIRYTVMLVKILSLTTVKLEIF